MSNWERCEAPSPVNKQLMITVGVTRDGSFTHGQQYQMAMTFRLSMANHSSQVGASNVRHNTITNNFESGGNVGIAIGYAEPGSGSHNIFAGNIVEQASLYGILVQNGSGKVFCGNRIANNSGSGLGLGGRHVTTENNLFFHNIFKNNTANFEAGREMNLSNAFDSGAEGNYWDDYLAKYPDAKQSSRSRTAR
jgi:hypothetical protein